jgi:peptidoglycan/LPS O-acetylase OafA/YrhL
VTAPPRAASRALTEPIVSESIVSEPALAEPALAEPVVAATVPPAASASPSAAGAEEPARPAGRPSSRLADVDLVRLLTFIAVVGVHSTGATFAQQSVSGNAALMLLHFTREAFFFLTAFVLTHTYRRRPLVARAFWPRRLYLVGVPYAVWTAAYASPDLVTHLRRGQPGGAAARLGYDLITGNAWYHLYFLLVTLQVYVLFPPLLKLIRRAAGHHGIVLAASALLQVFILVEIVFEPAPPHCILLWRYAHVIFLTYEFWIVLGVVAALHADAIRDWLGRHLGLSLLIGLAGAAAAELWYCVARWRGQAPFTASSVFAPIMVVWGTAVIVALFGLGARWASSRRPARLEALIDRGSDISFGVYLVHPAILAGLVALLPDAIPAPASTLLLVIATVLASAVVVDLSRSTALSLAVAGRPRRRAARTAA